MGNAYCIPSNFKLRHYQPARPIAYKSILMQISAHSAHRGAACSHELPSPRSRSRVSASTGCPINGRRNASLRGADRHTAVLAVGLGMTVRQFLKLPGRLQAEAHKAYLALMSPANVAPLADPVPAETRMVPRGHMSVDLKLEVGRRLLAVKASLPRGHFGPWLDKQEGLSRGMARQCMALATGRHQDARGASAA